MKDDILTILSTIGFTGALVVICTTGLVVNTVLWLAGVVK